MTLTCFAPLYGTPATIDLASVMLEDSASIQERDVAYVSKREGRIKQPLYTVEDALQAARQFRPVAYGKPLEIAEGVRLTLSDAGHMLGSSIVRLELREKGMRRVLVFSGDLGRAVLPILKSPEIPADGDVVILESTYGNRLHPAEEDLEREFEGLVRRVHARKGKILIPAFSVGRTQHITYILNALAEDGRLPDLPVFVDSPLAAETTEVFKRHTECYAPEVLRQMEREADRDPLGFRRLQYTKSSDQSRKLNDFDGPCIIISASGMCEHGRILHHLTHHGQSDRNCLLFVGYQAEGTLGRKILEGERRVRIYGQEVDLRAEVVRMEGLSAHADRPGLEEFIRASSRTMRDAFIVHGEPAQSDAFAGWVKEQTSARTLVPGLGMEVAL